jgi:hypothetical protein
MGGHASAETFRLAVTGLPWWFHLAQKARRSETARRPCPGHDISQVLEKRGLAPLFSLAPVSCVIPGASKGKSPVAGPLCRSSGLVERAQQYGAICAPELSYCGMQPGSCGPANDAVAALSASAAPNPRAPRYLMTRVFMVVLRSSVCVKAEEREGVVRFSRSPIPRFGRIPSPPGNCPPPASHDAGWQKRERWPMRSSPKQAPIRFWSSCSSPFAGLAT